MTASRRFIVKIGSQALCSADGMLDTPVITHLAAQVAQLRKMGIDVLLVSSGAVAAGRGVAADAVRTVQNPVAARQVLAAAGQVQLMERWQQALQAHGLGAAQVLLSKSDFNRRQHYLNMRACLEGILQAGLVPIVNENDVVAVTELMFTDNDELAGLLAGMMDAETLALLSSVPGVRDPASGKTISRWDDRHHRIAAIVQQGTSQLGRGGMHSKLAVARKAAALGTSVVIADGRQENLLISLADGSQDRDRFGTWFAANNKVPPQKRWLASMDHHALGVVQVNAGAREALLDAHRLTSLLPVGVVRIEGDFHAGDVIQVRDEAEQLLGCGRSGYDAADAKAAMGKRDQKPLIHYDYLYLFD